MLVSTGHVLETVYSRLVLVQELVDFAALVCGGRGGSRPLRVDAPLPQLAVGCAVRLRHGGADSSRVCKVERFNF